MVTIEKTMNVLNDLIDINLDRVAGFEKAAKNLKTSDTDLKTVFTQLAGESRSNSNELAALVLQYGGNAETRGSTPGVLHSAWLDVKATFSGHNSKILLEECARGEEAIKKAYQYVLAPENGLNQEPVPLVRRQKAGIDAAHGQIKALQGRQ